MPMVPHCTPSPLRNPGATFSKFLRKIIGRFLILGKSYENIRQRTNLEIANNDAIIIVINTFIFASCWMTYMYMFIHVCLCFVQSYHFQFFNKFVRS